MMEEVVDGSEFVGTVGLTVGLLVDLKGDAVGGRRGSSSLRGRGACVGSWYLL